MFKINSANHSAFDELKLPKKIKLHFTVRCNYTDCFVFLNIILFEYCSYFGNWRSRKISHGHGTVGSTVQIQRLHNSWDMWPNKKIGSVCC